MGETEDESELDVEEEPSKFARFYDKNRRRFQLVALAVFLVAVGLEVSDAVPRDVDVALRLPNAEHVREASVEYRQDGEVVRLLERSFPEGAPSELRDTVELSPGDYEVEVVIADDTGASRALTGSLTAPADGVVRIALDD